MIKMSLSIHVITCLLDVQQPKGLLLKSGPTMYDIVMMVLIFLRIACCTPSLVIMRQIETLTHS